MSQEILNKVEAKYTTAKRPEINVGDTVIVHTIIRDGDKKRIQKFQGIVIAEKGSEIQKMFTVRKISYGVGVEKIFPVFSTNIDKIEVVKHANVRRSKLYYMRKRVGKAAMKLKAGTLIVPEEGKAVDEKEIVAVAPIEEATVAEVKPEEEAVSTQETEVVEPKEEVKA